MRYNIYRFVILPSPPPQKTPKKPKKLSRFFLSQQYILYENKFIGLWYNPTSWRAKNTFFIKNEIPKSIREEVGNFLVFLNLLWFIHMWKYKNLWSRCFFPPVFYSDVNLNKVLS